MGADIFVFVTFRQDQQQAFTHLYGAPALGAGEQGRLQSLERSPSLLRHRCLMRSAFPQAGDRPNPLRVALRKENKSPLTIAQYSDAHVADVFFY